MESQTQIQSQTPSEGGKFKYLFFKLMESHHEKIHIWAKGSKGRGEKLTTIYVQSAYTEKLVKVLSSLTPYKTYIHKAYGSSFSMGYTIHENQVKIYRFDKEGLLLLKDKVVSEIMNDNRMSERGKKLSISAFEGIIDRLISDLA